MEEAGAGVVAGLLVRQVRSFGDPVPLRPNSRRRNRS